MCVWVSLSYDYALTGGRILWWFPLCGLGSLTVTLSVLFVAGVLGWLVLIRPRGPFIFLIGAGCPRSSVRFLFPPLLLGPGWMLDLEPPAFTLAAPLSPFFRALGEPWAP